MLHKRARGNIGEDIACKFLINQGFFIRHRNFQRKWGELDIVAEKNDVISFFEVKSIVVDDINWSLHGHRPEENVDGWKVKHLRRIVETYLDWSGKGLEFPFDFHVLCVYIDLKDRKGRVKWLKNLIL